MYACEGYNLQLRACSGFQSSSHTSRCLNVDFLHCYCTAHRNKRRDELVQVQQSISEDFASSLVGQEVDVLVDGVNEDGWLFGRTQYDAPGGCGSCCTCICRKGCKKRSGTICGAESCAQLLPCYFTTAAVHLCWLQMWTRSYFYQSLHLLMWMLPLHPWLWGRSGGAGLPAHLSLTWRHTPLTQHDRLTQGVCA